MSLVHILAGDDWMRIPHAEVRRVKLGVETRAIPPNVAGGWGTGASNTVTITTVTVWVLAVTLASGAVFTVEAYTNAHAEMLKAMRQDIFLHDIEQDVMWAFDGTTWHRGYGRPEITDPAYRKNA